MNAAQRSTQPKKSPFKNPHRINVQQTLEDHGYCSIEDARAMLTDSVVPACCAEGCEIEPDGKCEHGCPAITLALGII